MKNYNSERAGLLDEVRGFAILCMVAYHIMFTLREIYGIHNWLTELTAQSWFDIIWAIFAGTFIFISGIVCRYSSNNLKRGAGCFFLGMLVTYITAIVANPNLVIMFGILHLLGISMLLFGLGQKLFDAVPSLVGLIISIFMFSVTTNVREGTIGIGGAVLELPRILYNARLLFPLGFRSERFASGDYFPLLPWFFLFMAGAYFGVYVKNGNCPNFFYTTRIRILATVGRHTIWIYLLHMPIAILIMDLIFGGFLFGR
ncbi:MAG: DUF1624 domain-containing protein [Oscillospiraceae bacterium]|nr:DUF1624 domain-containing protein [Oscillospiraceae bacterium]